MEVPYVYTWIIVGLIAIAAVSKIVYQAYKNRTGEQGTYQQVVRISSDNNQQTSQISSNAGQQASRNSSNANQQKPANTDEFGPVNYYANARHGQKDCWFQFLYRKVNGQWLTYILRMPSLNGRSGDLHLTHRYRYENIYWICYDPQPRTLEGAQSVSRAWSDRELEYISTGVPFEEQVW